MKPLAYVAAIAALFLTPGDGAAQTTQPVRGIVPLTVIPCTFQGYSTPGAADMATYRAEIDAATGWWNDVADGHFRIDTTVMAWTQIDKTWNTTQTEGSAAPRNDEEQRCLNAAKLNGRGGPDDGIRLFLFHPGHDVYGGNGRVVYGTTRNGAASPAGGNLSLSRHGLAHELGHGLGLQHAAGNLKTPTQGMLVYEYGDRYGIMGANGHDISAYARDRLGLFDRTRVLRFGWDQRRDRTITLADINHSGNSGYHAVRIPFDNADPNHYLLVEYSGKYRNRSRSLTRTPQLYIYEVMKPGVVVDDWGTPDRGDAIRSVLLYDNRTGNSLSNPTQSYSRNGVTVSLISEDSANRTARVRITNSKADWCVPGTVWREATGRSDKACVSGARRDAVRRENQLHAGRVLSNGNCRQGYVWREATGLSDKVCVTPSSRALVRRENQLQTSVTSPRLAWAGLGPNTCKPGLVWREAFYEDYACVTPARRAAVRSDNRMATSRVRADGRCFSGYVWREGSLADRVCVTPAERSRVRQENRDAAGNRQYRE